MRSHFTVEYPVAMPELADITTSLGLQWVASDYWLRGCCNVRNVLRKQAYLEQVPKPAV